MSGMSGMDGGGGVAWAPSKYGYVFAFTVLAAIVLSGVFNWSVVAISRRRRKRVSARTGPLHTLVQFWRELCYVKVYRMTGGELIVCAAYIGLLLSFLLSRVWNATAIIFWEALAFRAAHMTIAQLPFLFALSTKRNLLAFVLATSYERLNIYHRLIAVSTLTTATLHMGYFLKEWLYYDAFADQWEMMSRMLTWGSAAWGLLIFLVASSYLARPFRYDIWLGVHIASAAAFIAMAWLHIPVDLRAYLYAAIAVWAADRLTRAVLTRRRKATVEVLSGAVRLKIEKPLSGFVHVTVPRLGLASHPLTLSDGAMTIKVKRGWTRSLHRRCMSLEGTETVDCLIDGPYASSELPPSSFSTVVLIGGGTGNSYTHALAHKLAADRGVCTRVLVVEVYRHASHLDWFTRPSEKGLVYVTRDGDREDSAEREPDSSAAAAPVRQGRPDLYDLLDSALPWDDGESGVFVCGPRSMADDARRAVLRISDERAAKKGLGSEAIYLHVEEH